jgi:transposase-like protein
MSEASPRFFSTEYKVCLVARLEQGEPAASGAGESGVARKLFCDWLKAYRARGLAGLNRKRGRKVGWRRSRQDAREDRGSDRSFSRLREKAAGEAGRMRGCCAIRREFIML